jgi:lysine 6-dehydrogenase
MGYGAAYDLIHNSPDVTSVTIADFHAEAANNAAAKIGTDRITAKQIDAGNYDEAVALFRGHDSVISCVNYWYNEWLSKAAIETKTNLCDLGGNNYVVDKQLALDEQAKKAGINIIPDCGLAPGMVSILAMHGAKQFETLDEIHIRVGGLPQDPQPPLDYQLVFSVEGLINEYIEVARVIRDGKIVEVPSMTELESLAFDGFPPLEAFQTSGGTSTLPDTFSGKIKHLDYKTIRYAGHCDKFKTMIDLGLCSSDTIIHETRNLTPRRVFADLLEKHLPADGPDYVLVRLEFVGTQAPSPASPPSVESVSGRTTLTYDIIDKLDESTGLSAMMRTTAFPASIIAQMMARGDVSTRGATPQEIAIDPDKFVAELGKRNIDIKIY